MQEYPKWLYHKTHEPKIVNDPDEHAALGRGWAEEPFLGGQEFEVETETKPKAKKNAHR